MSRFKFSMSLMVASILLTNVAAEDAAKATVCTPCHLPTVELGLAAPFAVLATNTVTDTMDSTINGHMGTSTGTTLPVYGAGAGLKGTSHPNDATAIAARAAATAALLDINGRSTCVTALGGVAELGGLTLKPGIYTSTSSFQSECSRAFYLTLYTPGI